MSELYEYNGQYYSKSPIVFREIKCIPTRSLIKVQKLNLGEATNLYKTTNKVNNGQKDSILIINSISALDEFTNKYGFLDKNEELYIDWVNLKKDFKGFGFGQNDELDNEVNLNRKNRVIGTERFYRTLFENEMYGSWIDNEWNYEVILFI